LKDILTARLRSCLKLIQEFHIPAFKLFQSPVSGSGIYQQFQALEKFDSRLAWQAQVVPQTIQSGFRLKTFPKLGQWLWDLSAISSFGKV